MSPAFPFAAPFVTGVVALMVSQYPYLTAGEVIETLRAQAEDLGESGWDQFYGWGLVNAYAAVSLTPIPESASPVSFILIASATTMVLVIMGACASAQKADGSELLISIKPVARKFSVFGARCFAGLL